MNDQNLAFFLTNHSVLGRSLIVLLTITNPSFFVTGEIIIVELKRNYAYGSPFPGQIMHLRQRKNPEITDWMCGFI
jgi:hypothetical protein